MEKIEKLRNERPEYLPFEDAEATMGENRAAYFVGEYLPEMHLNELEILRIHLASTTGDIYSIRLRINEDNKYEVRVQDEYLTEFYNFKSEYDDVPTQGEIFDLLMEMYDADENLPHFSNMIEYSEFTSINQITHFIKFDSLLYFDLDVLFVDHLKKLGFN